MTGRLGLGPAGVVALLGSVVGRGPFFVLGAAAAVALPGLESRLAAWTARRPAARWAADLALVALLGGLALLLRWVVSVSYLAAELDAPWWHLLEGILWTGVLLLLLAAPLRVKPLLVNPVLGWLGLWSYSLYIIHFPLIWNAFNPRLGALAPLLDAWAIPAAARPPLVLAACVALAALSYAAIERPFLRRKARVAG